MSTEIEILSTAYNVQDMGTFLMVSDGGKNVKIADWNGNGWLLHPEWVEKAAELTAPADAPKKRGKKAADEVPVEDPPAA